MYKNLHLKQFVNAMQYPFKVPVGWLSFHTPFGLVNLVLQASCVYVLTAAREALRMASNAEWERQITRRCGNLWGPFLHGASGKAVAVTVISQVDVADATLCYGDWTMGIGMPLK